MAEKIRQHTRLALSYTTSAAPRTSRSTCSAYPPPVIHPDGSRRPEGAGAAAYVRLPGAEQHSSSLTAKLYLGDQYSYTSAEAEYWAAMLGLDIIHSMLDMGYYGRVFYLGADYRGVLHSLQMETSPPSYAYMASMVQNRAKEIMRTFPGVKILPVHTPGHSGIEGNERADRAARDAARGETSVDICENE